MRAALVVVLALCLCADARVKRQAYGYDAPVVAAAPVVATTAAPAAVLATAAPAAEWAAPTAAFSTAAPVAVGWPTAAAVAAPAYSFPAGHPWATAAFRSPYAPGYPAYGFPYGAAAAPAAAAAWPYGTAAAAAPRYYGAAAWPYGVPAAQPASPYYGGFPYGQAAFGGASPYGLPAAGNFGFQGLPYQSPAYQWGLGGYNWDGSAAFPSVAAAAAVPATIAPFPAGSEVSGENVTVSPVIAESKKG